MSTDKTANKHDFILPALSVIYLRNAINNPVWASQLDDWVNGCDTLRIVPKITIPRQFTQDEDIFKWADENIISFTLSDKERDVCRIALRKVFDNKGLPINEYATLLISTFSLK